MQQKSVTQPRGLRVATTECITWQKIKYICSMVQEYKGIESLQQVKRVLGSPFHLICIQEK